MATQKANEAKQIEERNKIMTSLIALAYAHNPKDLNGYVDGLIETLSSALWEIPLFKCDEQAEIRQQFSAKFFDLMDKRIGREWWIQP
jgi:hypothetical protein